MLPLVLSVVIAYLTGSVPFGYLFGKLIKGVDVRDHGSGNIGATNVFRVVGRKWGILVLFLDAAKGFLTVWLIAAFFHNIDPIITLAFHRIIIAVAVVSGHNWTIFLKFKGGKGVAASIGALMGICPLAGVLSLIIWVIIMSIWRYVSLASLAALISLPIFIAVFYQEKKEFLILVCFGITVALLGVCRHSSNIKRLVGGKEKKIGER